MNIEVSRDFLAVTLGRAAFVVASRTGAVSPPYISASLNRSATFFYTPEGSTNSGIASSPSKSNHAVAVTNAKVPYLAVASDDKILRTFSFTTESSTTVASSTNLNDGSISCHPARLSLSSLSHTLLPRKPASLAAGILPLPLPPSTLTSSTTSGTISSEKEVSESTPTLPSRIPTSLLFAADRGGGLTAYSAPMVSEHKRTLLSQPISIYTALTTSLDSRYVITASRDERITVIPTETPWQITSVCAGHTRFVSCLHVVRASAVNASALAIDRPLYAVKNNISSPTPTPSFSLAMLSPPTPGRASSRVSGRGYTSGELLVSGGGDGCLRVWHWPTGTLLHTLYLYQQQHQQANSERNQESSREVVSSPSSASAMKYGTFAAAGPHADAAYVSFQDVDEDTPAVDHTEEATTVESTTAGDATVEETTMEDAGVQGSGKPNISSPVVPPTHSSRPSITDNLHHSFPVKIVEHASTGLLAAFLTGESAVRIFRIYQHTEPDAISVAIPQTIIESNRQGTSNSSGSGSGSGSDDASIAFNNDALLPQVRIAQIGVISLAAPPLTLAFAPSDPFDVDSSVTDTNVVQVEGKRTSTGTSHPQIDDDEIMANTGTQERAPLLLIGGVGIDATPTVSATNSATSQQTITSTYASVIGYRLFQRCKKRTSSTAAHPASTAQTSILHSVHAVMNTESTEKDTATSKHFDVNFVDCFIHPKRVPLTATTTHSPAQRVLLAVNQALQQDELAIHNDEITGDKNGKQGKAKSASSNIVDQPIVSASTLVPHFISERLDDYAKR